jgi:NADH-quinone oxidoreductase subunit M
MLWLYRRVVFGAAAGDDTRAMPDLNLREVAILTPIAIAVLWMGVYPKSFQDPMKPAVAAIVERLEGRQMATLPTNMTLAAGAPMLVPAAAYESAH